MKCLVTIAVIMSAFAYKLNNCIASADTNCLIRQHLFHAEVEQQITWHIYIYCVYSVIYQSV